MAGGNLFQIALQQLGDSTQATRIAALNNLSDFFLSGVTTLLLPQQDANATGGVAASAYGNKLQVLLGND